MMNQIEQLEKILNKTSKNLKLFTTPWEPNGTSDLVVTDSNYQILTSVPNVLFGAPQRFEDRLGNFSASFYGESVGMIAFDCDDHDAILDGEIFDVIPLAEIDAGTVIGKLAGSPTQTFEESATDILNQLAKACK